LRFPVRRNAVSSLLAKLREAGARLYVAARARLQRLPTPVLVGGGVILLGGAAGSVFWLPKLVREQVISRVEERTGMPVRSAEVSLGLGSVTIDDLVLGDARDARIRARNVVVDAGPLMLALRGTRALDGLRVDQLEIDLPLQATATQALIERLKQRIASSERKPGAKEPDAGDSPLPAVSVGRVALHVSDGARTLVRLRGRAEYGAERLALDLDALQLGTPRGHSLELEQIAVRGARTARGLLLQRIDVGSARAVLAATEEKPADAAQPQAEAEPPAPTNPAPAPAAATPPAPSLRDRVLSAMFERLADDAVFELKTASVHAGSAQAPPILQNLRATLRAQPGRALSLAGSGKAQGGGSIGWDVLLRPEQLQADGKIELRSLPLKLIAPFLPAVPWYEPELGRVDAELVVKTEADQTVTLSGEASLRDAAISAARIAAAPVRGIELVLRGNGRFLPLQSRLEIAKAELAVDDAALQVAGAVEWNADHYLFDIDATLPPTPCTSAVRAIPEDLLGDMGLATWNGKLSGRLRVKLDSRALDSGELAMDVQDRCEFATVPVMADLRRFQTPFVHTALEPDGSEFEMETGPGTPAWAYLEDISPLFVHAVLSHEDGSFFSHKGFSPSHIRNALVRNLKEGRYVVGASTITMQLVKNVFLHREKTLARKIQEVLLTWWIERVMEKRDILELYLNVIEYGPNVYGIRHGARHYFNRLPSQLSPAEAVYLSTILPNPKRYHSHFERGALSPQWVEIMRRNLVRLRERGSYSPELAEYGLSELQNFRFVPEGAVVASRQIPGATAPLPYMEGYDTHVGWDAAAAATPFEHPDERLPARVDPSAVRPQPSAPR